jgi:hypothetical protein
MGISWDQRANRPDAGVPRTVVRVLLSLRVPQAAAAVVSASTVGSSLGRETVTAVLARALWIPDRQVAVWNVSVGSAAAADNATQLRVSVLLALPRGRFTTPFGTAAGLLPPVVDATVAVNLRLRSAAAGQAVHGRYDPALAPALASVDPARTGGLSDPAAVARLWQALAEVTLEAAAALQRTLAVGCSAAAAV